MDKLDINKLLGREKDVAFIKDCLQNFEKNRNNLSVKKGIYIYGNPGSGKSDFIVNILKELNYDIIKYDAGDIRNKSIIDTITRHNMSDKNIMSLFHKKIKKIVIVMDEIDGMNNGDKGGINSLIKLIRPKKTKKQKQEEITMNPIICIGNYHIDKKIKELMKVCHTLELKSPTSEQVGIILDNIIPEEKEYMTDIIEYVQGDLRKVKNIYSICKKNKNLLNKELIQNIFRKKSYNDDTKKITMKLINQPFSLYDHNMVMNETDRTIVGLLWHENIIDILENIPVKDSVPFYLKLLNNMCFADYIDRITFQKQIWQFNEMSSLIKTFKNNKLFHDFLKETNNKGKAEDIRFTKVLTKYSTEYNNSTFIQNLCQQLSMDKKDLFSFFFDLKEKYDDNQLFQMFENYEINKLDINRIFRYLEKYTKENCDFPEDENEIDSYEEPEIAIEEE